MWAFWPPAWLMRSTTRSRACSQTSPSRAKSRQKRALIFKTPSLTQGGYELQPLTLNLSLLDAFKGEKRRRIAYERLLLEAISDNSTLFVRRDEAEAAWLWIDRIIEGWARTGIKPAPYQSGSWGPAGAFALTERNGHSWYE